MCGIAGYAGPARRFDDQKLGAMVRAIEHRGPDDCGVWSAPLALDPDSQVWLGSRRLAIQDLSSAGHQPMVDPSGAVMAFNGEIYNFLDLRAALDRQGEQFRSRCDTEVALRLWSRDGLAGVERWRAMFGAAVWDPRREELWLLRDPWGIKPLYYHYDGAGLAFCSEVRGLLAAGVPRSLSRRGVADYLEFGAAQDPVTVIDGVYALLPGHALRWSAGKIDLQRYAAPAVQPEPDAAAIEQMLREIVRQQLIADVPVVVFLSGGVDSSVVALAARQEAGAGVHTMSVVFEEQQFSEQHYAHRVARQIGADHSEVLLRGEDAVGKALDAIGRMDQPTIDGVNSYVISEAAKRAGFTVALSGLGGDEFFGGYTTFFRAGRLRALREIARRAPILAAAAGRRLQRLRNESAAKLGRYLEQGDFTEHPYFLQRRLFFPSEIDWLRPAGEASHEADRLAEDRRESLLAEAEQLDALNQVSLLEARTYMANMLLRDSDQMSMAHSLELRVPFVDHLLAARLLATPGGRKGFGRERKAWLRESFGRYLPAEVFARPKMGFTLPFEVWLKGPLKREIEQNLLENDDNLWHSEAVSAVWDAFLGGRMRWSRPWALYVLSRWVRRNVHGISDKISTLKSTT